MRAGPIGQPYLRVSVVGPLRPPSLPVHVAAAPRDSRGVARGRRDDTDARQLGAADTKEPRTFRERSASLGAAAEGGAA